MKTLSLRRKEDRRIRRGHPWIFSNEVETGLAGLAPGELVEVRDHQGRRLGVGYVNPRSLILVRMLTRHDEEFTPALIMERVRAAKSLRERLYPGRAAYRAVYSESDLLPGLIVDKYGPWLAVQVLTAGMEALMPVVMEALTEIYSPEGVVMRNDSGLRELEGLPLEKRVALGDYAGPVDVEIDGLRFAVDLMGGQKTGFFLDQVDNYRLLDFISDGAECLDVFCHTGAWALGMAKRGARSVVAVDSSAQALTTAGDNARSNGLDGLVEFREEEAFDYLRRLGQTGRTFDLVAIDPPAFVKSRARIAEGLKGYRDLNVKAMRAVKPGGFLISSSCSRHVERESFLEVLRAAASGADRAVRLLELRAQSKDHPSLIAAPETEYLKCALMQVL